MGASQRFNAFTCDPLSMCAKMIGDSCPDAQN
jgi:hypothetical protein